jgi:hypothetical protein
LPSNSTGEQHADQEVPHHPAGRGEPEDAVAGAGVEVQQLVLDLLDEDPALRVDDRLGQPGRPGAEQDPQRVIEPNALKRQLPVLQEPVLPAGPVQVAEAHHATGRRKLGGDRRHHL